MKEARKCISKGFLSLLVVFSMLLTASFVYPLQVFADEDTTENSMAINPRAVPLIGVYIDGTQLSGQLFEMYGSNTASVEIRFTDTEAKVEPITVTLSNGAKLLVDSESDITFIAGGTAQPITDLTVSADRSSMTFKTSTTVRTKIHSIQFEIESPSTVDGAEDFEIYAKVGTGLGSRSSTIDLISGLTIEAPEEAASMEEFIIEGNATYQGGHAPDPSFVFVEMINKETGLLVDEVQFISSISADNRYSVGPVSIPDTYDEGIYLIRAYLIYDDYNYIDMAQKEILITKEKSLGIEAPNIVSSADEFMIEGDAYFEGGKAPDPSVVFVEIVHKETGASIGEFQLFSSISADNRYSFGPLRIPDTYEDGIYLIQVYLIYDEMNYLAVVEKEIELKNN